MSGSPITPPTTSASPASAPRHRAGWWVALGVVVLVGAVARLWNLDWDRGQHLHPDERHWSFVLDGIRAPDSLGEYFATGESPLDPYTVEPSFVYGTLPLFTTKAAAAVLESDTASPLVGVLDAVGVDLRRDDGTLRFDGRYGANLIGRLLSAIADTVTIALVGCLARLLAGRAAGLAAASAYALAVLPIQQSHFLGPDAFFTMFATGALLAAGLHVRRRDPAWLVMAGALVGAATACRIQGVILLAPLATATVIGPLVVSGASAPRWRRWGAPAGWFAAAGVVSVAVFRVAQPYSFDGWGLSRVWIDDLRALRELQAGADIPPNLQWVGRTRLVYPLGQLARWGVGPGLSAAALLGTWVLARRRVRAALVPAAFVAALAVVIATSWTPTMRYLMPLVPMAAVAAGAGFAHLLEAARAANGAPRRAIGLTIGVLATTTLVWGVAFVHGVYGHANSRVAASEWIAAHVPAGSTFSVDAWDDGLPLGLAGMPAYGSEQLRPFDPDSPEKIEQLVEQLGRIDVVVVSSQRARDSVERLPARFPSTLRYYTALADGSLGFDRVAAFHNVPRLGPLRIDTSSAEEAFSVYDHPPVELYRRTDRFSAEQARRLLDPALASTALAPPLREGSANALLATPSERSAIVDGNTFAELFPRRGPLAAAMWLAGWLALVAAGVSWSTRLLPRTPAGAAALSLVLGPLTVTLVVWSLAAWGVVGVSTWLVRGVAAAFVIAGGAAGRRDRHVLRHRLRRDRVAWSTVGAVAVVAFGAVLAVRLGNPDLWHPARGGEKPMELAYFTSIARSSTVPPPDPWFAGGVLNYYYLGFFHVAVPTRALGIAPEVAFGLALATVAASATAVAAAVGHDLVRLARPRWGVGGRSASVAGVVSAAGLLVVGNLDAARQVVDGSSAPFDWWRTSRVHAGTFDVTEFPAWSFLFGDLHPHVLGTWLTGLAVLLGVALVADAPAAGAAVPRRRWLLLALLGAVAGAVQMTHTWDLPAVAVLIVAAVVLSRARSVERRSWRLAVRGVALDLVVVGAVALVLTRPYRRRSMVFNDGIERAPVTTRLVDQLVHFGLWWAVAAAVAVLLLLVGRRSLHVSSGPRPRLRAAGITLTLAGASAVVSAIGWGVSWVAAVSVVLVVLHAGGLVAQIRTSGLDPAMAAVAGLLAAAVGLAAVPEVVIVAPDIERLNTVFKFTFQAWQLAALATGPAVVLVAARWSRRSPRSLRAAGAGVAAVALVATLAFPVLAVRPRLADRPVTTTGPTLDGLAYLTGDWTVGGPDGVSIVPADDLALVEWFRREVAGQPTIVEMVGQAYGWNARISVLTGLPTVLGWPWHETQQRLGFSGAVDRRFADVEALYTSADPAAAAFFLRAHRVEYVVVGTVELAAATPAALATIESLPGAEVVFRSGDLRIIAIDQPALPVPG